MPSLPALLDMMSQLVATPSISCSQAQWDQSNQGVIALLESWLNQLGFQCEVMPLPDQPGKYNLIATLGSGDGGLVLSGHTDTVPFDQGRWQSDPFKLQERDHRLYGLGSCDMKSFFAIALDGLRELSSQTLSQPLIVLATADEESSMSGARALVQSGKPKGRYALIGEPTSLTPVYAHKGFMMEHIRVTGRSGHSSNPALGTNALDAMHQVIGELMRYRIDLQQRYRHADFLVDYPTLNFGRIHGGDNPNRICGRCDLEFDLRALPGMSNEALFVEIEALLPQIAERTGTDIQLTSLCPDVPSFSTPVDSKLVRLCEKWTGQTASTVAFATEGPFLHQLGLETLVLGPGSIDQAHQPNEYLALDQIKPMQSVLQSLIQHYCLRPPQVRVKEA